MACLEYNPFADYVSVTYKCPHCGKINKTSKLSIPAPDWLSDSHSESIESDVVEVECENEDCKLKYEVVLATGIFGGEAYMKDDIELLDLEEYVPNYDLDKSELDLQGSKSSVESALDAIQGCNEDVKQYMYKLLYANVITMMEAYLAKTLRREVLKNEDTMRKFTETYLPYRAEAITLSDVFNKKDSMSNIIRETLKGLMYHNLPKIRPIYKAALDIDLGNISDLYRGVIIRHDLVHRNGVAHDGTVHTIKEDMVRDILSKFFELKTNVDNQIMNKYLEDLFESIEQEN